MRSVLVGPAWPYRGGIAHFTATLAREFARRGDVHVINFRRLYPSLLFPGRTQYDESDSPMRVDSERIVDSLAPWTWVRAGRRAAALRPDVVVVQWWQPFFAPSMRVLSRFARSSAPVVFLCHNVLPHESSVADRALVRLGLGGADAFVVQSREDGRRLESILPGARWAFHPHPIYDHFDRGRFDRESARRHLGLRGEVVLFFGLVRPYKGLGTLLEAFARFARGREATLVVAGEFYEPREPYDRQVERLGIGDRVRWIDRYVPDEEVEPLFRAADVVVLPYRSATQSGVVQTAYGFARPVIVTRVGGLPDVVRDGETGFVVEPDDAQALADAMRRFFDEARADAMEAAVIADRERFSWERCADTIVSLARAARA